ncbi:FAD-dependent oxidoreductase [Pseudoprimorskyibacter insulae]|uniref:3-oxosteroid 1-dehydrogenase n=1 Tax=Pseudoprimorskyibacter insulae TaxID=1695997 RepID=A0A2R8AY52_9RHOB|nr:FAD-dependent oxidoreductase [Pseudoprimorskyibacter insulae]SPF80928.1 3-oxosteroid 1-dehydrogenase [Pseudoprimorskyibacter insulae]
MRTKPDQNETYDVIVIGSGASGLATAITAKKHGASVVVIEKEPVFGGTTAFSGGVLWVPMNRHAREAGVSDTREAAIQYMKEETGNFYNADMVETFIDTGPEMIDWFERETEVKFIPTLYPDYHPDVPGGVDVGRSVLAAPFDTSSLGENLKRLRPPLATITFMGMMFNSSNADIKHFFNATKSARSFAYVTKRMAKHFAEVAKHGRGVQVTSGNALAARLAKSAFDLAIEIFTDTPAKELLVSDGKISGVRVAGAAGDVTLTARKGVVIATGGFAHDVEKLKQAYPHLRRGGEHFSPVPEGNTGDGIRLAEAVGGHAPIEFNDTSAWMPVSKVPMGKGKFGAFPHLLDRYKPGIIAVLKSGKRFTNESESYHDVGAALMRACEGQTETAAWLICDHPTIRKYGLGYAKPAPVPLAKYIANGYLQKGATLAELAAKTGIDPKELEATVVAYNGPAERGEDPQFGRGKTSFNRYLADPDHKPNPCVGPIQKGPFYALKIIMGDLGTFDGLRTTVSGQVLNEAGAPIEGLFAVGNDRASIMGGNYPGAGITLGPAMVFGYITGRHLAGITKGGAA